MPTSIITLLEGGDNKFVKVVWQKMVPISIIILHEINIQKFYEYNSEEWDIMNVNEWNYLL